MKRDFGHLSVAARNRRPRRCGVEPLENRYLLTLFGPPSVFPSGNPSAWGVAAEDFNHDGNLDVAIGGAEVAVLLGDGGGGFSAPALFNSGDPNAVTLSSGDFDGDGHADLVAANTDGSAAMLLNTTNVPPRAFIHGAPAQSPEGTPITLTSTVIDPDSSEFTYAWSVTKNGLPYSSLTPTDQPDFTFTPDDNGTYVVNLSVTDKDGGVGIAAGRAMAAFGDGTHLVLEDAEGGVSVQVPVPSVQAVGDTRWSRDGQWITFTLGSPFASQIYVVRPDGTDLRRVTAGWGDLVSPSFSPDGQRIAFHQVYGHLYLINADGTNLVDTGVLASYTEWSPDGNKIVFSNWALPGGGYNSDLFVYDIPSGSVSQITHHAPGEAYNCASWSPDGTQLVFGKQSADGDWDVWRMNADGSDAENLTPDWDDTAEVEPCWSSDGGKVVFLQFVPNTWPVSVWSMDPDGLHRVNLTPTPLPQGPGRPSVGIIPGVSITVTNAAPEVLDFQSSAPLVGDANEGEEVVVSGIFTDPGTADTHTAAIDWGDGTASEAALDEADGWGAVFGSHTYTSGGVYTITLTLADDDGATATATASAVIAGAGIHGGVLQIVGTDGNDYVVVKPAGHGSVAVYASFLSDARHTRSFRNTDVQRIQIVLGDGDDRASIAGSVTIAAVLHGGSGNDRLTAGGGAGVLLGGSGDDVLMGGRAREILIGGEGQDRLYGGGGDDILIGSSTSLDPDEVFPSTQFDQALLDVLAEWKAAASYSTRVGRIRPLMQAVEDNARDYLYGNSGRDWFFAKRTGTNRDILVGRTANEWIDEMLS